MSKRLHLALPLCFHTTILSRKWKENMDKIKGQSMKIPVVITTSFMKIVFLAQISEIAALLLILDAVGHCASLGNYLQAECLNKRSSRSVSAGCCPLDPCVGCSYTSIPHECSVSLALGMDFLGYTCIPHECPVSLALGTDFLPDHPQVHPFLFASPSS